MAEEIDKNEFSEEKTEKKPKKKNITDKILALVLIILVAFLILKFIETSENKTVNVQENETKTITDISDIQKGIDLYGRKMDALTIHHKGCDQCFNSASVLAALKEKGVDFSVDEKYMEDDSELEQLVEELGITRLPAILLSGETEGLESLSKFEKKGDYIVLESPQPPYYYFPTKKIIGYVDAVLLVDKDCTLCPKIGEFAYNLQWDHGVAFSEKRTMYVDSEEADILIKRYNITKIPTYIFNGDLLEYDFISENWDDVGTIESDGALVLRLVNPPYMNPQTNKLEGVIDIVFIVDENCNSSCIDAEKTSQTMKEQFNLVFGTSRNVDSSSEEGKELLEKYNIEKLNAFVMSDEAQKYPGLMMVWNQTGRIAEDGSLVLG